MHFLYRIAVCAASTCPGVRWREYMQEGVMMKLNRLPIFLFVCFAAVAVSSGHALEMQTDRGVDFIVGGISDDERIELAGRQDFSLLVKTAAKAGNYLSDVNVKITDAKGITVFETTMNGPWLLVRLAPGRYALGATYNGVSKTQKVFIPKSGRREAMLYWDVQVAD
jgi:hypothetical protein